MNTAKQPVKNPLWLHKWSMDAAKRIKKMQLCSDINNHADALVKERDLRSLLKLEEDIKASFKNK